MTKQVLLLNANAGKLASGEDIEPLVAPLGATIHRTRDREELKHVIDQSIRDGVERIIVGGGDGTLNTVLNAMPEYFGKVQLALLPLGTANDFARSVNIPPDIEQAIAILEAGRVERIDVGRLTVRDSDKKRYFLNVSMGGFSSLAKQKLEETRKDLWKTLAYALSAIKALPELTEYQLKVSFDGEPEIELPAYNIAVANAMYAGGGIPVAPEASIHDGLLDVVIFGAGPGTEMAGVATKTWIGVHLDDEHVLFRRARRLELHAEPKFDLTVDGETSGCCPVEFDVLPAALDFVVGPPVAD